MLNTHYLNRVGVFKGGNAKDSFEELCGTATVTFDIVNSKDSGLTKLELFGGCKQNVTPKPSVPVDIITNRGTLRFGALGNNLLNSRANVIVVGKYISNSGVVTSAPSNCFFDFFIPVKANTEYTLSTSISLNYSNLMEYDASFGFVKRTLYGAAGSPAGKTTTHTTGETTAYVKIGSNISGNNLTLEDVQAIKWMFNEGFALDYEEYKEGLTFGGSDIVRIGSKNLNQGMLEQKGYTSTGGVSTSTTFCGTLHKIKVKSGQKYTVSFGNFSGGVSGVFINTWLTDGTWNARQAISSNGKLTYTIPDGVGDVNFTLYKTGGITIDSDSWMQVEYGAEATEYQPYALHGEAEAEMLLSVGSYADVQDMVKGVVTRKVGVKVFDGTESGWLKGTNANADGNSVFYIALDDRANMDTSLKLLSSHYAFRGTISYSSLKAGEMSITQTTKNVYFDGEGFAALADWKAYLAEQYAKGTPVIVIYPLADEATESGKTIQNKSGNSQVFRNCEISNLETNICYLQKVEKPEEGGSKLIKFYVQHTGPYSHGDGTVEYTAKEGMTWKEFCESEYNINSFSTYEDAEVLTYDYDDGMGAWGYNEWGWLVPTPDDWQTNKIRPNQVITDGTTYYEVWDSSGIGGGWG